VGLKFTRNNFTQNTNIQINGYTVYRCSLFDKMRKQKLQILSDLIKTQYLSRLSLTGVQIAQQPKVAVRVFVAVFFLQTLSVSRVDGGEVAAVHCGPSLRFGQNQGNQLWARIFSVFFFVFHFEFSQ